MSYLAICIIWFFICGLVLAGVGALSAHAYQAWTKRKARGIRERGSTVKGFVVEKRYAGGPVAFRRKPLMKVRFSFDGKDQLVEQVVEDDAYFHFQPGDEIEIVVLQGKQLRFVPEISLR